MAVVVVSFETRDELEGCLTAVRAARPAEVVVVDNASGDGSADLVRDRFGEVRLLRNDRNRGYGAAANQGVAACSSPVVLLLNPDTVVDPDGPAALARYLDEHPEAAVAGPRLVNADGSLQPSTSPWPGLRDMLLGETGLHHVVRRTPGLRERFLRTWSHDAARAVPWVRGAALALRRSAFEAVGGFDEAFYMYWEEVDLSRRLAAAGHETHFAPVTTVRHRRAVSTSKAGAPMRRAWLVSYRLWLLRHASPRSARLQLAALRGLTVLRLARDATLGRRAATALARPLLDDRDLWRP